MASQVILPDDEEGTSPSRPLSPFCSHFSVWFLLSSSCVAPVMALLCLSSTGMAARSMGIDRAPQMHMGAINWKIPEMLSWHPKPNMCQTKSHEPAIHPMLLMQLPVLNSRSWLCWSISLPHPTGREVYCPRAFWEYFQNLLILLPRLRDSLGLTVSTANRIKSQFLS